MMHEIAHAGFIYTIEEVRRGEVVSRQTAHNILPTQGINHMLETLLLGGAQVNLWHLMLYEHNYAPVASDTAATFSTLAGESTAYLSPLRHEIAFGPVSGGAVSNTNTRVEVEFTASRTIHGGAIISSAAKGSTGGVLLSAVRFSSPRLVDAGTILRVTTGIQIISV